MTCEHLKALEQALLRAGHRETSRGQAWSKNCREWVYFDCILPLEALREHFQLADCVEDHKHLGTHDGQEAGFVCREHLDAVMGHHPEAQTGARVFSPSGNSP